MMLTRFAASFSRSGSEQNTREAAEPPTDTQKKTTQDTRLNPVKPEAPYRRRGAARRVCRAASSLGSGLGARRLLTRSRLGGGGAERWCDRRERRTNGLRSGCGDALLEFRQFRTEIMRLKLLNHIYTHREAPIWTILDENNTDIKIALLINSRYLP